MKRAPLVSRLLCADGLDVPVTRMRAKFSAPVLCHRDLVFMGHELARIALLLQGHVALSFNTLFAGNLPGQISGIVALVVAASADAASLFSRLPFGSSILECTPLIQPPI